MNIQNESHELNIPHSIPIEQIQKDNVSIDLITSKIPQVQSNLYGPIEGKQIIKNQFNFLENEERKIIKLMNQATLLDEKKVLQTQEMINKAADFVMEEILIAENRVDIESQLSSFLEKDELFEQKIEKTGIKEIDLLAPGSIAIISLLLLNRMKEIIKLKEERLSLMEDPKDPVLEREIDLLKKWVEVQSSSANSHLKRMGVQSILSSPKAITTLLGLANISSSVLTSILGWVGMGFGIIAQVRGLKKQQGEVNRHTAWTEEIKNQQGVNKYTSKTAAIKNLEEKLPENTVEIEAVKGLKSENDTWVAIIKDSEIDYEDAKKVYERQKEIFNNRRKSNLIARDKLINPIINELKAAENYSQEDQEKILLKAGNELKAAGIEIPSDPEMTVEEMGKYLSDPVNQWNFNKMMLQKKEALSVSLRNGLRTLANKKEEIDKGFLNLGLKKAKGLFAATMVFTAMTIALKVLAIAGVIAAGAAATATGFGLLAIGIGFSVLGAIYLYIKKPNIFKTYLQGIQLKLLFWRIPLAIKTLQRNFSLLRTNKISEQIHLIGSRVLEVESLLQSENVDAMKEYLEKKSKNKRISGDVKKILENHKGELEQNKRAKEAELSIREKKLENLSQSLEKFSEKVKILQGKIDEAGWKDFERMLNRKKSQPATDEIEILVEHLMKDAALLEDSETKKILDHMDVDLKKMKRQDLDSVKKETAKALRTFFAMEEGATLHMIKKQTMLAEHGLR